MADFHQTGVITSLHRLGDPDLPRLERELLRYASERPVALVLPSLYSELHGPALKRIVEEQGGCIELESTLGNGAKFRFSWPAGQEAA